ncbi:hypothetical protein PIB30_042606 [Stylosanthes scabra]|uniref:Fe-S metabolism associated domain-containing protein n=1 Tax=Stylosanthes scabra TaxID=79078 RepID=A0ABU6WGC6_9FABA|nr:hypothetical protein [Stylosanthes scabra]
MLSSTFITASHTFLFTQPLNNNNNHSPLTTITHKKLKPPIISSSSIKSQSQNHPILTAPSLPLTTSTITVKLNRLASEFNTLTEPIERVKRLLDYASLLPPFDDSDRVPQNRISGCSTQVWVVSAMDNDGKLWFRADSDSEISKGFCWCLVWALNGAYPMEILHVTEKDLGHVDILGLGLKAKSRINTWHSLLLGMQKAAKDLLIRRELEEKAFCSSMVADDDHGGGVFANGKLSGIGIHGW